MLELMSHISMELHSLTEVTLDSCSSFQRNKNERFFLCKDVNYLIGCFTVSQIVFNWDDFDMKQFDIDDHKSLKKIIFNSIDAKFIEFSFTKQNLLEANFARSKICWKQTLLEANFARSKLCQKQTLSEANFVRSKLCF